jgi:hypothetical protein
MLPTGSGKTLIAALLIGHYANAIEAARARGRRCHLLFLAPTKLLVKQQVSVLRATTPLQVDEYTGDAGVDFWSASEWSQRLGKSPVIVATPEVVRSALNQAFLRMEDILLLVLDECHHCMKSHPMRLIVKSHYTPLVERDAERPRILGLTASPHNGKATPGAGKTSFAVLQENLHATIVTALDWEQVTHHTPRPEPRVVRFEGPNAVPMPPLFCGSGAPSRARRALADALAELGLWGAAASMRFALAKKQRIGRAGLVADAALDESTHLCALPQAAFGTALHDCGCVDVRRGGCG